ncbi:MAG: hypothetical protein M3081_21240 [Gemmatimonadota bacterium]|nr:hypothetical protein [Gemmatimonadota bacterium]
MTRTLSRGFALALAGAGAGCSKAPPKQARPDLPVAVATVRKAAVPYTVEANGMVTPLKTATAPRRWTGC